VNFICTPFFRLFPCADPLEKAESYVALRRPYLLNDLKMQRTLMDRRRVYDLLEESGIDVPRHVFVSRDGYISTGTGDGTRHDRHGGEGDAEGQNGGGIAARTRSSSFVVNDDEPEVDEHDDHIEVNGVIINKPFVEKPVDADDHNIAIYYPSSAGGGCKKLFRKVGDRSSEFYPEINEIRRDGSYIYETFMETQGTDVKVRRHFFTGGTNHLLNGSVGLLHQLRRFSLNSFHYFSTNILHLNKMYTVGPDYGHAEARKSPAVDGKVERNDDGKEVRFPVILTLREKEIARR
jgi:inositol hexakisphosphate/diphosphoinositol-pentakisphosphate kinase